MKILVIGATGLLGSSFLKSKVSKSFILKGTSRRQKKRNIIKLDLNNLQRVKVFFNNFIPDIIINCAAQTDVDKCNKNYKAALINNSTTVKNIVKIALTLKKKPHIIHISTDQIYNKKKVNKKNTEKDVRLSNHYSKSKYLGEKMLRKYKKKTIIRTNFFGVSQSSYKISFSDKLILSIKKNRKISLPDNIYFSPIIIKELVKIVFKIVNFKIYGTYNIGSSTGTSKYDFGILIAKLFKYDSSLITPYHSNYQDFNRPHGTIMNVSKIEKRLNINLPSIRKSILMLKK